MNYLKMTIASLLPIAASVLFLLLNGYTSFKRLSYLKRQLLIGLLFGALACFSTMFSIEIGGAATNVRDAAPLCAGLIFGSPAGIIAGVIGGVFRWVATPLFGIGAYTRLGCSIATVCAGLIGAGLRKFLFDNKRPAWGYGIAVGLATEVFHMLLIFLTNMEDVETAFSFVSRCTAPMTIANAFTLAASLFVVSIPDRRTLSHLRNARELSMSFQRWLLLVVCVSFLVSSLFTVIVQTNIANNTADELLRLSIIDLQSEIDKTSDNNLLSITNEIASEISFTAEIPDLDEIARKYKVSEINIVDDRGFITASTFPSFIGYDMASGEQSAEFLVLLNGEDSYVQPYQPISYDASLSRKYAGVTLFNGGFLQVGYDAAQFHEDIVSLVERSTAFRHVNKEGCIIIANTNGKIVSDRTDHVDLNISTLRKSLMSAEPNSRFIADVHGHECYCMYAETEGYYIIASIPTEEVMLSRNLSTYVTMFMEIVVFSVLFICVYFLVKKLVVDNIHEINDSLARITGGNLDVTVDVRSNVEFASLSDDINSTVTTLKRYIAEAAARIDKELEFAKAIQTSVLPSVFPPFPDRQEFDIFAFMATAKEVGGDFYDFYFVDHDTLAVLIADVSGKGIPAAMFMMTAKATIKDLALRGLKPEEVFTEANATLCEGNDAGMFVTAWLAYVNLKTGAVSFANAGHNPPLVKHKDGSFEYLRSRAGLVLAGMEGIKYRPGELSLLPGDELFLYTDGVTEATDANNVLYGEERLIEFLNSLAPCSSEELCKGVKSSVDAFVGDAPQFDDITMLSLKMK